MTAVEWLFDNLDLSGGSEDIDTLKKALEMERQQIINAFWNGDNTDCLSEQNSFEFAEKYYNKTYKKTS